MAHRKVPPVAPQYPPDHQKSPRGAAEASNLREFPRPTTSHFKTPRVEKPSSFFFNINKRSLWASTASFGMIAGQMPAIVLGDVLPVSIGVSMRFPAVLPNPAQGAMPDAQRTGHTLGPCLMLSGYSLQDRTPRRPSRKAELHSYGHVYDTEAQV